MKAELVGVVGGVARIGTVHATPRAAVPDERDLLRVQTPKRERGDAPTHVPAIVAATSIHGIEAPVRFDRRRLGDTDPDVGSLSFDWGKEAHDTSRSWHRRPRVRASGARAADA